MSKPSKTGIDARNIKRIPLRKEEVERFLANKVWLAVVLNFTKKIRYELENAKSAEQKATAVDRLLAIEEVLLYPLDLLKDAKFEATKEDIPILTEAQEQLYRQRLSEYLIPDQKN